MKLNIYLYLLLILISCLLVIPVSADFVEGDLPMNATYTFTGTLVDSASGVIIERATITDNLGFSTTITTGTFSNTYEYNSVTFNIRASGYGTKSVTYLVDNNTVTNISLTASAASNQVVYTTPHKVRFVCKDILGAPIKDMSVTVYGVETTLGSIDWVASLFGINLDTTPIDQLMGGSTGNDGSIVFIMLETEKYAVTFTKPIAQINETRYYYPKSEEYTEIFWPEEEPQSSVALQFELYNTTVNSTYTTLGVNYADVAMHTTNFTFYVDNKSGERLYTNVQQGVGKQTLNASFTVQNIMGGGYFWGFVANNTQYAQPIKKAIYLPFNDAQWQINILGAANGDPTATQIYNYSAIGIIVIIALIFGRQSIKFGTVITPLMALFFAWIGWLSTPMALIILAVAIGVLIYFRYAEEESGL